MADIPDLTIGEFVVRAGEQVTIDLPVADLYTHTPLTMPVQVKRGKKPGPTLFISAAVHGDEINGVEIVRRILQSKRLKSLRGTLIAVPVVNVQGLLNHSRYTPDRRDLNRSFPGSAKGSVAGRLAYIFANEIVAKADVGIDLHTAAIHRDNLPQIRADLDNPEVRELANAFAAPVMLHAALREGSLREHAYKQGMPMLLYEAGEALRFDEKAIVVGVRGCFNVMRSLGMLPASKAKALLDDAALDNVNATASNKNKKKNKKSKAPIEAFASHWLRADSGGILRDLAKLGARVAKGEVVATISGPFGGVEGHIMAKQAGIVIGRTNLPLVNAGDALLHVAGFDNLLAAEKSVGRYADDLDEWQPLGAAVIG